jgi:hypothetical protein
MGEKAQRMMTLAGAREPWPPAGDELDQLVSEVMKRLPQHKAYIDGLPPSDLERRYSTDLRATLTMVNCVSRVGVEITSLRHPSVYVRLEHYELGKVGFGEADTIQEAMCYALLNMMRAPARYQ